MDALDLRKAPPRRPRAELADVVFMPRSIDKIRATLPGGDLGAYTISGFTATMFDMLGIALEDVATAVTNQNVNLPTGVLWGPKTALTVQATGQLDSASAFGDIIVAYRNGAPVHLSEVGHITDDVQNNKTASWYNGARSIVLAIQRQPGTNTVDVSARVKEALARTTAGGVTVNDCMFHVGQTGLPFGGIGASGMGHYHGVHGFETFSK